MICNGCQDRTDLGPLCRWCYEDQRTRRYVDIMQEEVEQEYEGSLGDRVDARMQAEGWINFDWEDHD